MECQRSVVRREHGRAEACPEIAAGDRPGLELRERADEESIVGDVSQLRPIVRERNDAAARCRERLAFGQRHRKACNGRGRRRRLEPPGGHAHTNCRHHQRGRRRQHTMPEQATASISHRRSHLRLRVRRVLAWPGILRRQRLIENEARCRDVGHAPAPVPVQTTRQQRAHGRWHGCRQLRPVRLSFHDESEGVGHVFAIEGPPAR
jgi:hypothetical protein